MPTPYIDLRPFCNKRVEHSRYDLSEPFVIGDWVYATDGSICVRIPKRLMPVTKKEGLFPKALPEMAEWGQFGTLQWKSWPIKDWDIINSDVCMACNGLGGISPAVQECPKCHGECLLQSETCSRCHNRGWINGKTCPWCDGTTTTKRPTMVEIAGRTIAGYYDLAISALPDVQLGDVPSKMAKRETMLAFRFIGGEGLVMPLSV